MNSKNKPEPFPAGTLHDWEQAAREELQGADPWQKLTRDVQGLTILPFYTKENAPSESICLPASESVNLGPRTWYNSPKVIVHDAKDANAEALEHLQHGADGIFFELKGHVDFGKLLNKIDWSICALHFLPVDDEMTAAKDLAGHFKGFSGPARGAWYGMGHEKFPTDRHFHALGRFVPSSTTPVDTLAEQIAALHSAVSEQPKASSQPVALRMETGADFFLEIARLRAARKVWGKLTAMSSSLYLHAWSSPWTPENYAPHANMLKATTAAMAAILGGADAITIDPEDNSQSLQRRAARNVAILLREESRFAKVADPLAGAYFIDHLTNDITEKTWAKVTSQLRA
jgi:methylmalonyl-CoA mutase